MVRWNWKALQDIVIHKSLASYPAQAPVQSNLEEMGNGLGRKTLRIIKNGV